MKELLRVSQPVCRLNQELPYFALEAEGLDYPGQVFQVLPDRVGLSMEFAVGVMLIVLGLANLGDILRLVKRSADERPAGNPRIHSHAHSHGDFVHTHPHHHDPDVHSHDPECTPVSWLDRHLGTLSAYRLFRPLVIGVVHGLAGSAAVTLLVLIASARRQHAPRALGRPFEG